MVDITVSSCSHLFIGPRKPYLSVSLNIWSREVERSCLYDINEFKSLPKPVNLENSLSKTEFIEYNKWWILMNDEVIKVEKLNKHRKSVLREKIEKRKYQCWFCHDFHEDWFGPCSNCKYYMKNNNKESMLTTNKLIIS